MGDGEQAAASCLYRPDDGNPHTVTHCQCRPADDIVASYAVEKYAGQFEELGDRFVIETQFAVSFNPDYKFDGGVYFRFGSTDNASPFHFGFYYGEDGGLYFQGRGDRVVLLPREEMPDKVAYKFTVHADMGGQTFRVLVTSVGDDSFRYESGDINFQEGYDSARTIRGLYIGNNKPTVLDAYVDYIKITP